MIPTAAVMAKLAPSAQVRRSSRGLVHCIAQCSDCEWTEDAYRTAARAATRHVRQSGHRVAVDQGIIYYVSLSRSLGMIP